MKIYHNLPEHKNLFINPVVTIGSFDGVHRGHRKILSTLLDISKKRSGEPVVITFSTHPRKVLEPDTPIKIITSTEEKTDAIYNFGIPNIIVLNFTRQMSQMRAIEFYNEILINKLDAKYLVIGYDHAFGKNREGNYDFLNELSTTSGVEITKVDEEDMFSRPVSSSWIRNEIEAGNIKKANSLLGWNYTLTGTVLEGKGRGRALGYPTANVVPIHQDKIIPGDGVYAVRVTLENDVKKNGMLNIGTNPTFADTGRTIEVNIFDFNEFIYNTDLTIEFYDRIRDEIKFETPAQLVDAIARDKIKALQILERLHD